MKKLLLILALLVLPAVAHAQFSTVTCTHGETGTCRQATTCSQANVQAAVTASSAGGNGYISPTSLAGDGVYIPAGSCSWSSSVSWTDKNIGVIGGVGGTTTISPSGDGFDVYVTGVAGSGQTTAAAFRISNLTFSGGKPININPSNANMTTWAGYYRIDNITENTSAGGDANIWFGPVYGVWDHDNITVANSNIFEQAMLLNSEYPGSTSLLEGETVGRTFAIGLGDQNAVYIENSTFSCNSSYGSSAISDSESGPQRMVFRYNTVTGSCFHYAHWTRNAEWDGGRIEIYNNSYNCNDASCPSSGGYPGRFDAGTGVIFNNTIVGYPVTSFQIDEARGCGAQTGGLAGECAGNPPTNSNVDVNAGDASAPGWPCGGQVGTACIAGSCTRANMNSVPFIMWNNGAQSGCSTGGSCTNSISFNVDGPPGGGSCTRTMTNYLKSTAHSLSGGYNGAIDYYSGASKPSSVGIYTGIATYTPFTYPYPTTNGTLTVATPTLSPTPGNYGSSQTVTLATATGGATICYTTNGSTPATNGAGSCQPGTSLYSSPFLVSSTSTVKAVGTLSGSTDSAIASGTYTINGAAIAPTFSPGAGTYGATQSVTISSATAGSTLCYTTDGSTPTANGAGTCTHGTTYSTAVSVASSLTLKVVASKSGWNDSSVSSAAYVINGAASTPTFSPVAGSYGPTQNVVISTTTPGATLCYTANGSTPTSSSPGVCAVGSTQYVSAVSVSTSLTLKAIATESGFSDSSVGSAAYTINGAVANVTFSPAGGSYGPAQTVTLSTATGSSVICYTLDGSTPTATTPGTCSHGTTYSGTITVSASETITALGTKSAFVNSSVTAASYLINGTLATPTFAPVAGTYGTTQSVSIVSSSTIIASMTETSNANDMAGNAPHRNTYTNCATGYSGGSLQPTGVPVGQLYCTSADKTAALANGGPNNGVVTSTISGTGTSPLDNGQGAGGTDSGTSITATYAGTTGTGCAVGSTFTSNLFPGLTLPGEVANARLVFGISTGSFGNSSILTVSKYNTNGDTGNNLERIDCASPNTTSVGGQHYEWDSNYNTAAGSYMGFGMDYDFTTSKIRADFQGGSWINTELCPIGGGSCLTTYSWPAGDYLFSERHDYWDAGCTYSGSNCAHYGQICLQLWNAGSPVNSVTCYNIQNASTHTQISATPVNKTTWTRPQYAPQHQWDINATSATLTANVAFDSLVAFSPTATICYTIDGSTPITDGAGNCTHGTTYTTAVAVASSLTIKAIATQAGFTDSPVGSAAYVIGTATPTFSPAPGSYGPAQSVTLADSTSGATICYTTDGSTPTSSPAGTCNNGTTYSTAIAVSATTTIKAIGTKSGLADSSVASGTYTINGAAATPTFSPVAGTYVGAQSVTLSCSTASPTMYYTTDGSTPTTSSTLYTSPVFVATSLTVKAICTAAGFSNSSAGSAAYVITSPATKISISGKITLSGTQGLQ